MYTLSSLNGTARSRYSEDKLRKRYEKAVKPATKSQMDDHLLYIIKFFSTF
jgi:hypothetical protein